ncbi:MAG: PRD domain-containing protein [Erysipelotrichaceae bacterium]|nr:PRD domain-containing protein [Erysipelotrichaceae bacterium]
MKAIKRLNNNVVICLTAKGKEVIARGKGIGFHEMPYDIPLADIERTYYGVDDKYLSVIENIDDEYIELASEIVDYAKRKLDYSLTGNIVFTIADHLQFSVKRFQQGMNVKLPIIYDIQYLYPKEMDVGRQALKLIRERFKQYLPEDEAAMIAMHFINGQMAEKAADSSPEEKLVADITEIIEKEFGIEIDKKGFNYSRFVSHLNYLIRRSQNNELIRSENSSIYEKLKQDSPKAYLASEKITGYLLEKIKTTLTDEEKLYLILHINRLCSREDCYQ